MSNCYVHPIGGLGNQLFIIAAGYAYAKKHGKTLIIVADNWVAGQGNSVLSYKDTIFKNFEYGSLPVTRDVVSIHEKRLNYDKLLFYPGNVSLHGYFQSLKYFEEFKDEFISLLDIGDNNPPPNIYPITRVAFHVRRGDYLRYPNIHYVCKTEYFDYFLNIFAPEMIKGTKIYMFTDSPEHVKKEFNMFNYTLVETDSDVKELAMMSKCDIIVGSNSTFSWWASLIGKKTCHFPSKWYADGKEHGDIYREDMILHDV